MSDREKIVASLEAAKAEVAALKVGRDTLVAREHELTQRIAELSPVDGLEARKDRAVVLEAISDAARRLEEAEQRAVRFANDLEYQDARCKIEKLDVEYEALGDEIRLALKALHPKLLAMDQRARATADLERGPLKTPNAKTYRPLGLRVGEGGIELVEGQWFLNPTAWTLPDDE